MVTFSSSPLPKAVETSRSKYKNLTARFLKWLSCRADDMNITSLSELDAAEHTTPVPSKPKSSKGRGKKVSTNPQQPPSLPTAIPVGLLVKLAKKITQTTNLEVPRAVFDVLDQIIELRVQVGSFYSHQCPELVQSNSRHQYFIQCLRKIRDLLDSCPTSRPDNTLVKLGQFMSLLGLEDNPDGIISVGASSAPVLDEDWLPDNLKGKAKKDRTPTSIPKSDRPLSEYTLLADDDNGTDEAEMLAWMLFNDFAHLREHIRGVWEQYRRKEISLVTASFLTTQTVEIVKEMEEDFARIFPGGRADYLDIVKAMFHFEPSLDIRSVVTKLVMEMDSSTRDFTMCRAFHALWQFGMTIKAEHVPFPKPGFFPTFRPEDDRSSMNDEQLYDEDTAILMPHLSEVAMQCKLSNTDDGQKSNVTTVDEQALVRDMRSFIVQRSRPTPLYLIFQWAIYRDIVLVNRKELDQPLVELHAFARNIVSTAKDWIADYDPRFYIEHNDHSFRRSTQLLIDEVESHVLKDRLGEWKRKQRIANPTKHQLWHYDPWACGAVMYTLLMMLHDCTVMVLNSTGYLGSVAHLYHALRVHGRMQKPWPEMDKIVGIIKKCAFNDSLPEKGQCLASFRDFIGGGTTSGNGSPIYVTGVLPDHYGGSLLGRLSHDHHYKLTDDIVVELFPHPGDGVVARRSQAGTPSRRLRFGGKRCDALELLTVLRQRIEHDLTDTGLGLDLYAAQRMAVCILRRWANRTKEAFIGCFGPEYMDRPAQICFLPGFIMEAMENLGRMIDGYPGMSEGLVERIAREGVKSLEEGKEDLDKSLQAGARMFFL